jgi:hypothetical protein
VQDHLDPLRPYGMSSSAPNFPPSPGCVRSYISQESYSPDDNRFDLRPFLYPSRFAHQFAKIDSLAKELPNRATQPGADKAKVD